MLTRHAVESTQVSFRLIPKVLNAVYMIAIAREPLAVIDPTMAEASHIQSVARTPRVRVYNAVKPYFPPYHGHQRARAGIQHDPRIHLPAALQNTEHNHLAA